MGTCEAMYELAGRVSRVCGQMEITCSQPKTAHLVLHAKNKGAPIKHDAQAAA